MEKMERMQNPVMQTASDAILSKLSTSQKGYYDDPFLPHFARDATGLTYSTTLSSNSRMRVMQPISQPGYSNTPSNGSQNYGSHRHDAYHLERSSPVSGSHQEYQQNSRPPMFQRRPFPEGGRHTSHPGIRGRVEPGQRHQPVIRRGTHARVCVVDYAISTFLSLCSNLSEVQIVILGSGRDTTFLRSQCDLIHSKRKGNGSEGSDKQLNTTWYEVDQASVIKSKRDLYLSCDLLKCDEQIISEKEVNTEASSYIITPTEINLSSRDDKSYGKLEPCHLVSYDLRNPFEKLLDRLKQNHNFRTEVPTLFVMECVQMYLPEENSRHILKTISERCTMPFMAIFDPIIQHDQFGQVMAKNLTKARIVDPSVSLLNTTTLKQQVDKLFNAGFTQVTACDFHAAYETILTNEDRRRANVTEMLDEIEEWVLIMRHYCLLIAAGGHQSNMDGMSNSDACALNEITGAFCSVDEGNAFGFSQSKCIHQRR